MVPLPSTQLIGQKVGEYEVVRRLGMGGMGAVFEGRHPQIGKRVAIKVLLPQFSEDESSMRRFLAEARAVQKIRHRGIVDIFGFGELPDGAHYFVMEFLEGTSFETLLKTRRKLPAAEALGLMDEVLDAVAAAHQAGVVHRDLKPSNLFLVDVGRGRPFVKLLDFGVAKVTAPDAAPSTAEATGIVGTPIYMAPEQVNGLSAGPAADVYSLGVVLFEMLAGRPPFEANTPVEMMTRHLETAPPRLSELVPDVPPTLERIVDRMLSKRPQDRPGDAEALRAELARLKAQLDAPVRRTLSPAQRAALEEDVGPTQVRPILGGASGSTQPDITPIASPAVQRDEPRKTRGERGPPGVASALLPWDGDEKSGRQRAPDLVPVEKLEPIENEGPVPTLRPTAHSAPTLSVVESNPGLGETSLTGSSEPTQYGPPSHERVTERQPALVPSRPSSPAPRPVPSRPVPQVKDARHEAAEEARLSRQVLVFGLAGSGVVGAAVVLWLIFRSL